MSDDVDYAEGYPIISEEAVKKVRRVERANGEELLVGLPSKNWTKWEFSPETPWMSKQKVR